MPAFFCFLFLLSLKEAVLPGIRRPFLYLCSSPHRHRPAPRPYPRAPNSASHPGLEVLAAGPAGSACQVGERAGVRSGRAGSRDGGLLGCDGAGHESGPRGMTASGSELLNELWVSHCPEPSGQEGPQGLSAPAVLPLPGGKPQNEGTWYRVGPLVQQHPQPHFFRSRTSPSQTT